MSKKTGMTINLDEFTVAALRQLKAQIERQAVGDVPGFTLAELARHSIRKWCDKQAAPVPLESNREV